MVANIKSIAVNWINSSIIDVEVDINNWLPSFTIVWLPDQWVQESKERIRSALRSSWWKIPSSKIIVNLAPADIRKSWPSFDLSIAIWILIWDDRISWLDILEESVFIWELSLDWNLRRVNSVLPATIWARDAWFKRIFVPIENSKEASIISDIDVIPVENLSEVIWFLNWTKELNICEKLDFWSINSTNSKYDFKYILWQNHTKRALEISASWWHNILMNWPPWSWKTMLSKAYSTILPDLEIDEAVEISKIYSIAGLLNSDNPLVSKRPFRAIHHTASSASIIWWWRNAKPWEISLSHKWVLFLDELLEFNKNVLEILRQPLEDWTITVNRVNASFEYPADFTLVWAMNPCPCWYLTDPDKRCVCSDYQINNYKRKLSWPLLDRIDLFVEVPKVEIEKLSCSNELSESSSEIKKRVMKARNIQLNRFLWLWIKSNSEMSPKEIKEFCELSDDCNLIMKQAIANMNLSARSYYRIIKLARTIADLAGEDAISKNHILEALSYRKNEW